MISGTVNARREAVLQLRLYGPSEAELQVDAVIDTGYTGSLVVPLAVAAALGLPPLLDSSAKLADGTVRHFPTFRVDVEWGAGRRTVVASGIGDEPLIGMTFLAGLELRIEVEPGRAVEVRPLA